MKVGTIGFCANDSLLSKAIRRITRSRWSHTFVVAGRVGDHDIVIEADRGEVRLSRLDRYLSGEYTTIFFEPVVGAGGDAGIQSGLASAMRHLEVRYGYLQVVGIALVLFVRRISGLPIRNPFHRGDICSELDLRFLVAMDPDGEWVCMNKDTTTPEDVFKGLCESNKFMWPGMA